MSQLPGYLWAITLAGVIGILVSTGVVLYGGAVRAGLDRRRSGAMTAVAAVLFGGWLIASSLIAAAGGYQTRIGHGIPWMPVVVVGFFVLLLVLARIPSVHRALRSDGTGSRLLIPHSFRVAEGVVFLASMALGYLPALFAIPAGLGDIAIGIAAPFVAQRLNSGTGDRAARRFTLLGMADLIVALALGGLVGFMLLPFIPAAPAISSLPIVLIPTVGVPLLLALHVTSLSVLRSARSSARTPALAG
jgi:hypothetical protein